MTPFIDDPTPINKGDTTRSGIRPVSWDRFDLEKQERFLEKLNERFSFSFEYLLMICLMALFFVGGLLSGEIAVYLLALLIAPTIVPVFATTFSLGRASLSLFKKALLAFILSSIIVLLAGLFAGFIASQFDKLPDHSWAFFIGYSWGNIALTVVAMFFAVGIIIRNPMQSISVANVGLTYIFYLPLVTLGYLFSTGESKFILSALTTFFFNFGFTVISGILILFIFGVKPRGKKLIIPFASIAILSAGMYLTAPIFNPTNLSIPEEVKSLVVVKGTPSMVPTILPSPTENPLPTLISTQEFEDDGKIISLVTLAPTKSPTITLTPLPTPIWAEIRAPESNGANVRSEAGYKGKILTSILNGTLVQVLPEVEVLDGNTWVHIRLQNEMEGWIVRSLLVSSTPAADW
ncbi:MAG: hypothetical protein BGO78_00250 [Chloroflexi bacterium 44-23]|nr:MAG: hypothetical protein BGO78_00250 [Chloroflexi bacterium 44-23]